MDNDVGFLSLLVAVDLILNFDSCLLFIALCASFWTPATDEKKKATVETTHVVLEKV